MPIKKIIDPRYYQLAVQSSLLIWGMIYLDFSLDIATMTSVIGCALLVQILFTHYYQLNFNPLSAINSSMSILLLLHASHFLWLVLAIALAIASKFVLRWNNRHVFNPSNIGIVAVLLLSESTWLASGQWGHSLWWGLLLLGLGLSLFIGFSRLLTSLSFLVFFASLLFLRAVWLGDSLSIPVHQLQNGALLIFSFFMLSDPMTSPNSAIGRVMFGGLLALIAWVLQFTYYIPNAFLYALALSSPFVVMINKISWGKYYHWSQSPTRSKLCE